MRDRSAPSSRTTSTATSGTAPATVAVAAPNSKFYFDVTTGIGNATWRLIDPFGNILFSNGFSTDNDTLTLSQPGTYFLVLEGRRNAGAGSVNYAFNVVPDVASSTPLTIGNTVNASIGVPGESDDYTFTLGSPARLNFDVLGDFPNFTWTLVGPEIGRASCRERV